MKRTYKIPIMKYFILLLLFVTNVKAQTPEAIDIAGRQRMLTQKIAKDVLLVASGQTNKSIFNALQQSHALFDVSLIHLRNGNLKLNIPKSPDALQPQLAQIQTLWQPTSDNIMQIINEEKADLASVELVMQNTAKLLALSHQYVIDLSSANSAQQNKSLLQRVNLTGKLRMLSQKIATQALSVCYHYHFFKNKNSAINTINEFNNIIEGLIVGNDYLRLKKVASHNELQLLNATRSHWQAYIDSLAPLLDITYAVCDDTTIKHIQSKSMHVLFSANKTVQFIK